MHVLRILCMVRVVCVWLFCVAVCWFACSYVWLLVLHVLVYVRFVSEFDRGTLCCRVNTSETHNIISRIVNFETYLIIFGLPSGIFDIFVRLAALIQCPYQIGPSFICSMANNTKESHLCIHTIYTYIYIYTYTYMNEWRYIYIYVYILVYIHSAASCLCNCVVECLSKPFCSCALHTVCLKPFPCSCWMSCTKLYAPSLEWV